MMDPNQKEFLLHLYDKLWDNINQKESRVWTFLSVYGAVIGIALGSGAVTSLGLYGVLAVLLLTYWAVQIVLDADWWSIRNRTMVGGIEARFPGAGRGVIPPEYQTAGYSNDPLHRVSLLIFTVIAWLLYLKTVMGYSQPGSPRDLSTLAQIALLHLLFVVLTAAAVAREEGHLRDYYSIYRSLNPTSDVQELLGKEHGDRAKFKRRHKLGLLVAAAAIPVYGVLFNASALTRWVLCLAAALLLFAASLVGLSSRDYYRPFVDGNKGLYSLRLGDKADPRIRWAAGIFALSCIALVGSGVGSLSLTSPPSTAEVEHRIEQLKSDLAALQVRIAALADGVSSRRQWLRRAEAERLYLKPSDPKLLQALGGISRVEAEMAQLREQMTSMLRELEHLKQVQQQTRDRPKAP